VSADKRQALLSTLTSEACRAMIFGEPNDGFNNRT
jgi:hypothetical protein